MYIIGLTVNNYYCSTGEGYFLVLLFLLEDTMSYFIRGNEFYNNKNYEEAITYYNKAIEEKDNEAYSCYNAGVCYIKLKNHPKAIEMLTKAITLNIDAKYFFNLAYCYSMINDSKKALRYFNVAWALDNSDKDCEKAINLIINKYKKAP